MGIFDFLFKKEAPTELINLEVDLHSHILPGLDDGSSNVYDSVELIKGMQALGKKKFIFTPHIIDGHFNNNAETINAALVKLKAELAENKIDVQLAIGAEYYLDESFMKWLEEEKELLSFGPKKYLLFETSYMNQPSFFNEAVFLMKSQGYTPILAHPERYVYAHANFEIYERFLERDILFQLNINSLTGYYSPGAKAVAEKLIDNKMIHFAGSDCHKMKHIIELQKAVKTKYYSKLLSLPLLNNTLFD